MAAHLEDTSDKNTTTEITMLKQLLSQEIETMHCGCNMSIETTELLIDQATHPELKELLEKALSNTKATLSDFEKALDTLGGSKNEGSNALGDICEEARGATLNVENADARDLMILYKYLNMTSYANAGFEYYAAVASAAGEKEIAGMFAQRIEDVAANNDAIRQMMPKLANELSD